MALCSQCGNQAIVEIKNIPLCLNCYEKLQQVMQIEHNRHIQEINYLTDLMEEILGMPGYFSKYEIPQPTILYQAPVTFHNIKVDQSIIGSINTGKINQIDISMNHIKLSGNEELMKAIQEFTQSVIDEMKLNAEIKNQILEHISFIAFQATRPKEKQRSSIVKTVLLGVKNMISNVASLVILWDKLQPLLDKVFP